VTGPVYPRRDFDLLRTAFTSWPISTRWSAALHDDADLRAQVVALFDEIETLIERKDDDV
jgi:hypothetical protein